MKGVSASISRSWSPQPAPPPPARLVAAITASAFGVAPAQLRAQSRGPARCAGVRQISMYLAHVGFGLSFAAIGLAFGRDPSTVRHACAVVENSRDLARIDRLLDHLEWAGREFAASLKTAAAPRTGEA